VNCCAMAPIVATWTSATRESSDTANLKAGSSAGLVKILLL
jgi:hypothetical protein